MKKFSVYAIMAMGILTVSGAAFAGTTSYAYRGLVSTEQADTVMPADTVIPEKSEGSAENLYAQLADTVLPADTVTPEKEGSGLESLYALLADTVTPADTVAPGQKEEADKGLCAAAADTVVPADTTTTPTDTPAE